MDPNFIEPSAVTTPDQRPQWRRPELSILDVESGTLAQTGPAADGFDASTS